MLTRTRRELHFRARSDAERTVEISSDDLDNANLDLSELLEAALARLARANPGMVATLYLYSTPSANFHELGYSDFVVISGPLEVLRCVQDALAGHPGIRTRGGESVPRDGVNPFLHVEDGRCWQAEDGETWYAQDLVAQPASSLDRGSAGDLGPSNSLAAQAKADDPTDDWENDDALQPASVAAPTAERRGRLRSARADAPVATIRQTIESVFGLPPGSVKLCGPDGRPLRGDATIATLRRRWEAT